MGQYISTLFFDPRQATIEDYEDACCNNRVTKLQQILAHHEFEPALLRRGLVMALEAGSVASANELRLRGASLERDTSDHVRFAMSSPGELTLEDLRAMKGDWKPETAHPIFLRHIADIALLKWFLAHGVNPNFGIKQDGPIYPGNPGIPSYECADALESAASEGSVEAIRILLEAGANIGYGAPLHRAAASDCYGEFIHVEDAMSEELDLSRIPAMAALVEAGADVNGAEDGTQTQHGSVSPCYPLVYACSVQAVHRARWLLEHGADPDLQGPNGSAVEYVYALGCAEMKALFVQWARDTGKTLPTSISPKPGTTFPMRNACHQREPCGFAKQTGEEAL